MTDLKIDERHISKLCTDIALMMGDLMEDIETLEDKDKDIFIRYMSFVRLGAIWKGAQNSLSMSRHLFAMGFDVQHQVFQTAAAKENGWDKCSIERNPFFVNEGQEHRGIQVEFKKLRDEIKDSIAKAIKEKMAKSKQENQTKQ